MRTSTFRFTSVARHRAALDRRLGRIEYAPKQAIALEPGRERGEVAGAGEVSLLVEADRVRIRGAGRVRASRRPGSSPRRMPARTPTRPAPAPRRRRCPTPTAARRAGLAPRFARRPAGPEAIRPRGPDSRGRPRSGSVAARGERRTRSSASSSRRSDTSSAPCARRAPRRRGRRSGSRHEPTAAAAGQLRGRVAQGTRCSASATSPRAASRS